MKKVLLVDTSFSATPLRVALNRFDCEVVTAGLTHAPHLTNLGDQHAEVNYAELDALRKVLESGCFDHIVPGCNEKSYGVCAALAEEYGFKGLLRSEDVEQVHKKDLFRALCEEQKLSAPFRYSGLGDAANSLGPWLVKPTDGYSGNGIVFVEAGDYEGLAGAYVGITSTSMTGSAVIEEFVRGDLFSFSAFLREGEVRMYFNVAEYCQFEPYCVDVSYVTAESPHSVQLVADAETIAKTIGLWDGLLHIQYISNGIDYWLIEPTCRCPGDLYSELIERSTGYSYAQAYVSGYLSLPLPRLNESKPRFVIRHTVKTKLGGLFRGVSFAKSCNNVSWSPLIKSGERLMGDSSNRLGIAFHVENADYRESEMRRAMEVENLATVEVDALACIEGKRT